MYCARLFVTLQPNMIILLDLDYIREAKVFFSSLAVRENSEVFCKSFVGKGDFRIFEHELRSTAVGKVNQTNL